MARRSPLNPRYGKDAKVGTTKKSASAAKPKREIGTTPQSKPKPAAEKKARPGLRDAVPTSPEIRKWRKLWWVLFGVMVADAAISNYVPAISKNPLAMQIAFAVLLASFAGSLYIELVVIRRLRKELIAERQKGKKQAKDAM